MDSSTVVMWVAIYVIVYTACTFVLYHMFGTNGGIIVFNPLNVFVIAFLPVWIFIIKPIISVWKKSLRT